MFKTIACAARYGHQQLSEIGELTWDQLVRFNDGLGYLIESENKTGTSLSHREARGG